MTRSIRLCSPDGSNDEGGLGAGTAADEQSVTGSHENEWRGESANHLTDTKLDAKADGGDATILGADGLAGGLSGDGERTDEYDAAVMGLDD